MTNNAFSSAETNIESQPMVDTHSKRTLLIKTVETRDGQVRGNFISITAGFTLKYSLHLFTGQCSLCRVVGIE